MASSSGERPRVRAAIELSGGVLRYAEVDLGVRQSALRDHAGPPPEARLVRLGACDFEFDVAEAILQPAGPTHLETAATALAEIFDGSNADRLHIVVHPWQATSFLAPLPASMPVEERFEQVRQEAAMLADARHGRPVRVTATPIRREQAPDGRDYHWHHVLHVSDVVHARAHHLATHIRDHIPHAFVDAAAAVATLMDIATQDDDPDDELRLLVGSYSGFLEATLARGHTVHFSHVAEMIDGADSAYFTAAVLDRLNVDPAELSDLKVYGDTKNDTAVSAIEGVVGREAQWLNPLSGFRRSAGDLDGQALSAFGPVVGSALKG